MLMNWNWNEGSLKLQAVYVPLLHAAVLRKHPSSSWSAPCLTTQWCSAHLPDAMRLEENNYTYKLKWKSDTYLERVFLAVFEKKKSFLLTSSVEFLLKQNWPAEVSSSCFLNQRVIWELTLLLVKSSLPYRHLSGWLVLAFWESLAAFRGTDF